MVNVQEITQKVLSEVIDSFTPESNSEMETQIAQTTAHVTARILEEYQKQNRVGWPIH